MANISKSPARGIYALWLVLIFTFFTNAVFAKGPVFPQLTGRVVDEAGIFSATEKAQIEGELANFEAKSSDQIVVAIVKSLQDYEISEYGYQLGRHWGIGQNKLNNGLILLVAPNERKVRIEVGYGLEGVMPDLIASQIIRNQIVPQFKKGDMKGGIIAGVSAIEEHLSQSPEEIEARLAKAKAGGFDSKVNSQETQNALFGFGVFVLFMIIMIIRWASMTPFQRQTDVVGNVILPIILSSLSNRRDHDDWGGGGFGGGGGFSGGGGSFGGGGASGSW